MRITFDPIKREETLKHRGLDFEDAKLIFEGVTLEAEDKRKDYGEVRIICYGTLAGSHGDCWIRPAWRGSLDLQHEESQ